MSAQPTATHAFADPKMIAGYTAMTPQKVPGLAGLHLMTLLLLSECAPDAANILVLGAGGGLELRAFAEARPGWSFTGVDPSRPMLDLATETLGSLGARVRLIHGLIDDAPAGPFDGATCILTLHFLSRSERLSTLRAMHARMKPGAALVVAHHTSVDGTTAERWMTRSVAFGAGPGADLAQAAASGAVMAKRLPLLSVADEEAVLAEAGFTDVALFYAGFSFRGWVATA